MRCEAAPSKDQVHAGSNPTAAVTVYSMRNKAFKTKEVLRRDKKGR